MNPYSLDHIMVRSLRFHFSRLTQTRRIRILDFHNTTTHHGRFRSPSLICVKEHCERSRAALSVSLPSLAMEIEGFEPSTYGLQSRRSSQLSYIPQLIVFCLDLSSIKRKEKQDSDKGIVNIVEDCSLPR